MSKIYHHYPIILDDKKDDSELSTDVDEFDHDPIDDSHTTIMWFRSKDPFNKHYVGVFIDRASLETLRDQIIAALEALVQLNPIDE